MKIKTFADWVSNARFKDDASRAGAENWVALKDHLAPGKADRLARSYIGREMVKRGAAPELRRNFTTDNGNLILDCHGLTILNPPELERDLNTLAGLVTNGIFALRPADVLLLAEAAGGVRTLTARKA